MFNFCILSSDLNDLLSFDFDLPQLLNQYWNFNNFFDDSLNVLVDSNDLRNYFFNLNDFRNINSFLNDFLDFINFRDFSNSIDNFLYNLSDFFDLLNDSLNWNNFFSPLLNFNDSILEIRNDFFNFFNSLLDNNVINKSFNLNYFDLLLLNRNNSVSKLIHLLNLSVDDFNWNHFLNYSIDWDLNFNGDNDVSIDFNYLWLFNNVGYNSLHFNCSWNLPILNHNSFRYDLLDFCVFLVNLVSNHNFSYNINWSLYLQINISWCIDFDESFLNYRNMDYFFYFNNLGNRNDFLYNFLYDLGHFNYLFDNSWNNDNSLNNFFNLNNLGNFNQFFDNFLNQHRNSLDSLNYFLYWNDSFLDDSNDFRFFDKMVDDLLDFFNSILIKNLGLFDLNFFVNDSFNDLNHWFFNYFSLNFYDFMN